jgi:TPR repeat protein
MQKGYNHYENGKMFENEKKYSKAYESYKKAFNLGYSKAGIRIAAMYTKGKGTEKNLEKASKWYQKALKNKNELDETEFKKHALGFYRTGKIYESNLERGKIGYNILDIIEMYKKAAELGHPEAAFKIATFYMKGKGVKKNVKEAFRWYREASKLGHKIAANMFDEDDKDDDYLNKRKVNVKGEINSNISKSSSNISYENEINQHESEQHALGFYGTGRFYESNFDKGRIGYTMLDAIEMYKKAVDLGHAESAFKIATFYMRGKGVEKDVNEAFRWYRKASKLGHKIAVNMFDDEENDHLYERKANVNGNMDNDQQTSSYDYAQRREMREHYKYDAYQFKDSKGASEDTIRTYQTGFFFETGVKRGISKSLKMAHHQYLNAAKKGHVGAMKKLVEFYMHGYGTEKDLNKSNEWLQKLEKREEELSKDVDNRDLFDKYFDKDDEKDSEKTMKLIDEYSLFEDEHIAYLIGLRYLYGKGAKRSIEEAIKWFEKSKKDFSHLAQLTMKMIDHYQIGKEQDEDKTSSYEEKALDWYTLKRKKGNAEAIAVIGVYCAEGYGMRKDLMKAEKAFEKASKKGSLDAEDYLDNFEEYFY